MSAPHFTPKPKGSFIFSNVEFKLLLEHLKCFCIIFHSRFYGAEKKQLLYWHLWLHEEPLTTIAQKVFGIVIL